MKRFILLLMLFAAGTAAAQVTTATLGGRITDENGPIEGVTVVAVNQSTNAQYYATTTHNGWYRLHDLIPGGPYTVRIHYFGYPPLTVRDLYVYSGQDLVVDVDLEKAQIRVRCDDVATTMRLGEVLGTQMGGGEVALSPLTYSLLGQRVYTEVPFDVRQETSFAGVNRLQLVPTGSNTFHASAYGFYGSTFSQSSAGRTPRGIGGMTVATPLGSDDYQMFAGFQYDSYNGFMGTGRLDARLNESHRVDLTGGRLSATEKWAAAGVTSAIGEAASNRLQAGWYGTGTADELLFTDDFTYAAGAQRLLFGVQGAYQRMPLDSSSFRFDFYGQDVIRFGRRLTVLAGIRFTFPFAFSPRASAYYDVLGTGKVVLRAGTAVYGRPGASSWKNQGGVDLALPLRFRLSLEAMYGQLIKQLFYIKAGNVPATEYAFTARLERPLADRCWAVASYTYGGGRFDDLPGNYPVLDEKIRITNQLLGGFSYKAQYLGRQATQLAVLYRGYSYVDDLSPASFSWANTLEARLTQDIVFSAAGRDHTLQLTGYFRYAPENEHLYYSSDVSTQFLLGIRYLL